MTQDHRQKAGCVPPCADEGAPCAQGTHAPCAWAASYVYLLECGDGSFYCGWTNNLAKRVAAHQLGKGGRYTRSHLPVRLVYYEPADGKEAALRREAAIKKLTHAQKRRLIEQGRP